MVEPPVPKEFAKKEYKGSINYENVLAGHITRMAVARDTVPRQYASSVETYALMCPPEICDSALKELERLGLTRCEYDNINYAKMMLYDDLWRFINKQLKEVAGLIFKSSTYEIGLED